MALTPGFSAFVGSATQEKTYILQQKNINNRRVRSSIDFIMSNLELDRIAHLPEAPTVLDHKPVVTSIIYENLLPSSKEFCLSRSETECLHRAMDSFKNMENRAGSKVEEILNKCKHTIKR